MGVITTTVGNPIVRNGIAAGLLGAAAVALWFLIFDWARGHPFETPALLAATLLHVASDAALPGITWSHPAHQR